MNRKSLKSLIAKKGLKLGFIAEQLDIDRTNLWQKLNQNKPFKENEVEILCKLLDISDDEAPKYFFTRLC